MELNVKFPRGLFVLVQTWVAFLCCQSSYEVEDQITMEAIWCGWVLLHENLFCFFDIMCKPYSSIVS